jgi:exodeoxyribonuclease VII small subunit
MVKSKKLIPFEEAFQQLEEIVEKLEAGGDDLETNLALFEEGVRLTEICRTKLEEADQKIKKLVKQTDGNMEQEEMV